MINMGVAEGGETDAAALSSAVLRAVKLVNKTNILNKTITFSAFNKFKFLSQ
jgi:hypothetical protein